MKKILLSVMIIAMCLLLCSCGNNEALQQEKVELQSEINNLQVEIKDLETEKNELENLIVEEKEDKGVAKYIITFNIAQKHYNIDDMLKDSMNDISIQIPVDKEYYDSVEIGDVIDDSFRMGSWVMSGSYGRWDITIENKEIR